jgi:epoxyqueuosine reductase
MSLTDDIKEFALDLGYSRVGITPADEFSDHVNEVFSRGDLYDFYLADPRRFMDGANPKATMPSARSIICLVWDYARWAFPKALLGKIGRVYQARCYGPPAHRINGARYQLLIDFLQRNGCRVGQGMILPERRAGARAGVINFGKNNFAYAKGIGSFIVLSSIVVDQELAYDTSTINIECPEKCSVCMKACPTGAIFAPLKLDPRRCIAFNNWWTQDGRPPNITSHIPYDIRERMGMRVHGCDVCQEVCPRNKARLAAVFPEDPFLETIAQDFSLTRLLAMPEGFYPRRVRPIMYNYIQDKKYLQRNAAIALGNQGDPEHVPALASSLVDTEPLVREYAAWALGKIGSPKARQALAARLGEEHAEPVRIEIASALAMS